MGGMAWDGMADSRKRWWRCRRGHRRRRRSSQSACLCLLGRRGSGTSSVLLASPWTAWPHRAWRAGRGAAPCSAGARSHRTSRPLLVLPYRDVVGARDRGGDAHSWPTVRAMSFFIFLAPFHRSHRMPRPLTAACKGLQPAAWVASCAALVFRRGGDMAESCCIASPRPPYT